MALRVGPSLFSAQREVGASRVESEFFLGGGSSKRSVLAGHGHMERERERERARERERESERASERACARVGASEIATESERKERERERETET